MRGIVKIVTLKPAPPLSFKAGQENVPSVKRIQELLTFGMNHNILITLVHHAEAFGEFCSIVWIEPPDERNASLFGRVVEEMVEDQAHPV